MSLLKNLNYAPVELSFGTSGLRGLVTDMTDLECYINATGFLQFLQKTEDLQQGQTISIGGDLRRSTPRILSAVMQAVVDSGFLVEYCGLLPTPALAYWAQAEAQPCIMVTGSHIPDDRNGIKFYKTTGEVLKSDEAGIKTAVAEVREHIYATANTFNQSGSLKTSLKLPPVNQKTTSFYLDRFYSAFPAGFLNGERIVVYQHSAVGRDLLVTLLEKFGAKVTPVDRSDTFVSIDTENVTPENQAYFGTLAGKHPDSLAIVSTDGDSDRPFLVDENGEFHRGDVLGFIGAKELGADFAAIPVSSSDAVDSSLTTAGIAWQHTKIGSPYVIESMQTALETGKKAVVGWEVNGGFLTGVDIEYENNLLRALPTRDAFLPILLALNAAIKQKVHVSELFSVLPARFTQAGLIDNFQQEDSSKIITNLSKKGSGSISLITRVFTQKLGFGTAADINTTDGVRITFDTNEIAHIRPSGNAPQLRIYSVAATQERADEIVALSLGEEGLLRQLQQLV